MILIRKNLGLLLALALLCLGALAQATITIETVPVGDPGNTANTVSCASCHAPPAGSPKIYGSVGHAYNIGKYEVTAAQYTAFLNAVAADDTYGLYCTSMWDDQVLGCRIQRFGSPGSYTYSVPSDWANRPVNYVSFWGAIRFVNWLHNGQPTGPQDASTTEDGAYAISGYNGSLGLEIVRKPDAKWFIPTEDEWYKAAYYKGHGKNAGYYDYPTSSDILPGRDMNDPFGNNANWRPAGQDPIDNGKYQTVVGEFQNSPSPYGTFDQGGNIEEWNETIISQDSNYARRRVRGGSWGVPCGDFPPALYVRSSTMSPYLSPNSQSPTDGFRVAGAYVGPKIPLITSVSPNQGNVNSVVTCQINGQDFALGTTAKLVKQGQADIAASSVSFVDSTRLDCSFDLTGAKVGRWSVVVANPGGTTDELTDGFGVVAPASLAKRAATSVSSGVDCTITYLVSASQFYVESDDRSCGILVSKPSHGMSVGQRVTVTGTSRTMGTGEKYIAATAITASGTGTIEPLVLSNKAIGGGGWYYDSANGAGQKGMEEYRRVLVDGSWVTQLSDCEGMNNVGLLITTFGEVTYSESGFFYIDDGSACRDNSAYVGVKVLGTVPVEQGGDPVGKYVKVTGVVSCFKGTSPDTSLYRQVRAGEVIVIQ